MKRPRSANVALAAIVVAIACKRAPTSAPADGASDAAAPDLGPILAPTFARAKVPAIAYGALTRDTAILGARGDADVRSARSAGPDTPFEAASIAKTIIGTCVMQLVAEGRLALDEDVSRYVGMPVRHPKHARPVTVRMLLAHTSSIKDDLALLRETGAVPLDVFLRRYLRGAVWREDEPGTRMEYSNAGAALAALAVERMTGKRFADVSRERIFVPLRMTSSAWRLSDLDS